MDPTLDQDTITIPAANNNLPAAMMWVVSHSDFVGLVIPPLITQTKFVINKSATRSHVDLRQRAAPDRKKGDFK